MNRTEGLLELNIRSWINVEKPIFAKLTYNVSDPMVVKLHLPGDDPMIHDNIWTIGRELLRQALFDDVPVIGIHDVQLIVVEGFLHVHLSSPVAKSCISMRVDNVIPFINTSYLLVSEDESIEKSVDNIINHINS